MLSYYAWDTPLACPTIPRRSNPHVSSRWSLQRLCFLMIPHVGSSPLAPRSLHRHWCFRSFTMCGFHIPTALGFARAHFAASWFLADVTPAPLPHPRQRSAAVVLSFGSLLYPFCTTLCFLALSLYVTYLRYVSVITVAMAHVFCFPPFFALFFLRRIGFERVRSVEGSIVPDSAVCVLNLS